MGKPVCHSAHLLLFILLITIQYSDQLEPSQSQTLFTLQWLLNYPPVLSSWNQTTDFCNSEPNPSLTVVCYEDSITQLHIFGESWVPPLPQNFSIGTLFSTLGSLPSLKVLSLVSLGLWGSLPADIGGLFSLEILNISSNYLNGTIPLEISALRNLQTLILDHNIFTGQIPYLLPSLPLLAVLSLKNNSLSGTLPNSLTSLETLRVLVLSMNHFSGEVPNFQNLTNLQVLDLEDNHFGPHFPTLHPKLITLVLRKNRFRSGLPPELSSFYQLQKLDLSSNGFVGPFLPSLFSLPSINYLDIAANKFTGRLLHNMSCNAELAFVNLSSNLLTGELPSCLQWGSKGKVVVYGGNCLLNGGKGQHPQSYCQNEALAVKVLPQKGNKNDPQARKVLASSTAVGIVGGILLLGLIFLVIRKVHSMNNAQEPKTRLISENASTAYTLKLLSNARYICQTRQLGPLVLPAYRVFTLEELKEATNNFNMSSFMGEGSHGQVYQGRLTSGAIIAIRCMKMRKRHGVYTYTRHIELISKLRHCHLVSVLGHCFECYPDDSCVNKVYIVFEFVPNGTLRGCTSEALPGQKLTWIQRIAAVIGVAKGIQFLHTGVVPGVFSNNLKITDVLLDHELHTKIWSYNLPLLADNKEMVHHGTSSTQPKDSMRAREKYEDKNDIYDLGVILLEIIVGRPITSRNDIHVAKDLLIVSLKANDIARRGIVDPAVQRECSNESLRTMMDICVNCMSSEPIHRPSIEDVLWNLQFAAQVQDSWRGESQSPRGSHASSSP
ncbi:probable inactive leucine-rich repeat receptor-like protein kinase At3g03770 [Malania oleifera]|uniref:probable inactive leucine-rich repeat receptor-like protein kinase At3g03770 n=1 Tax=Malania oleifera TaxID=397392 RepID=UPI0025ADD05C|nr:probable inactive leucine-rich repeat receptor-like protein kinase At3g03770 [Malania oleifera]